MHRLQALKLIAVVLLVLMLAWFVAPNARQDDVALPIATPKVETQATPLTKRATNSDAERMGPAKVIKGNEDTERTDTVSPQTCEVIPVQGAHLASDVEEARAGAAEDVRDVCPSNLVTQVLENCVENMVQNAEGVLERQYRCLQKGNCRICGDDLARRNEIAR